MYAVTSLDISINICLLHKTVARYIVYVETLAILYLVKNFRVIQGIKFSLPCLTEPDREPNPSQSIHSTSLKTSFLIFILISCTIYTLVFQVIFFPSCLLTKCYVYFSSLPRVLDVPFTSLSRFHQLHNVWRQVPPNAEVILSSHLLLPVY